MEMANIRRLHGWEIAALASACAAVAALFALLVFHLAAPVGVYVASAGVAGIGVSLRKEPSGHEKFLWFVTVAILVIAEIQGIYLQEEAFKQNLKTETENFSRITGGLETAISDLRKSISDGQTHFDKTMTKVDEAINTETGGDTFCYFTFSPEFASTNGNPTPQTYFSIEAERIGKYPLRDVRALIIDSAKSGLIMNELRRRDTNNFTEKAEDKIFAEMEQATKGSETPIQIGDLGGDQRWFGNYPASGQDREDFDVEFWSFNTNGWIEHIALRRVDGKWKRAILVELYLPGGHSRQWTKIDRDFPRKNTHLDVNWPRLTKGRDSWDH